MQMRSGSTSSPQVREKKYQVVEPLDVLEELDGFSRLVVYPTIHVILMGDDVRELLETFREGEEEDGKSEI